MFSSIKNHPFRVEAFFESSLVLTFAVPKEQLEKLIPECLALDTFDDKWAFVAIAMVQTRGLRPKGFPQFLGSDFFLIGYRVFVRYVNRDGKKMRGLYILKSETDKIKMQWIGNFFTHYKYTTTDIIKTKIDDISQIKSVKSNFNVEFKEDDNVALPEGSPFSQWREARKFAGPLPFTFSYNSNAKEVLIIEGMRQNWTPKPVEIINYDIDLKKLFNVHDFVLANAFMIKDIPYLWKKGRKEIWEP